MKITNVNLFKVTKDDGEINVLILNSNTKPLDLEMLLLDRFNLSAFSFDSVPVVNLRPESDYLLDLLKITKMMIDDEQIDYIFSVSDYTKTKGTIALIEIPFAKSKPTELFETIELIDNINEHEEKRSKILSDDISTINGFKGRVDKLDDDVRKNLTELLLERMYKDKKGAKV